MRLKALYRVIENFLRSGTVIANNVNIGCFGTTTGKLFYHPVLALVYKDDFVKLGEHCFRSRFI
jgi:hypothetical protein